MSEGKFCDDPVSHGCGRRQAPRYGVEIVRTANSVYEVDWTGRRVRRLSGANDPTPNQGPDGLWQNAIIATVNGALLFTWLDKPGQTLTSRVTSVGGSAS